MEEQFVAASHVGCVLSRDEVIIVLGALDCLASAVRVSAPRNDDDLDEVVMRVADKIAFGFGLSARGE